MLKLKFQYFCHLIQRTDSLEKPLMLGKIEGRRRRGQQRMRWLDGITDSVNMSLSNSGSWWWTGRPGVQQSMVSQRAGHDWLTELYWTLKHRCINKKRTSKQVNKLKKLQEVSRLLKSDFSFFLLILLSSQHVAQGISISHCHQSGWFGLGC